jgi:hypothetical protein
MRRRRFIWPNTDQYLVSLVRAVEDGAESPALWMTLHSGDLVTGVPRPSREFVHGTFNSLMELAKTSNVQSGAKSAERPQLREAYAEEGVRTFNVDIDTTRGDAVTLVGATVLWGGRGEGARMPVIRVHLSSVALWWIAGGKEFKGGAPEFFGVAVSI